MARKTPTYNFTINQGADYDTTLTWKDGATPPVPIDVTGYTAQLIARENTASDPVILDMNNVNSQIIVGTTDGTFRLVLTAAETAALNFDKTKYQLEVVSPSGFVTRLMQGTITLSTELPPP